MKGLSLGFQVGHRIDVISLSKELNAARSREAEDLVLEVKYGICKGDRLFIF